MILGSPARVARPLTPAQIDAWLDLEALRRECRSAIASTW
jgi:hypothetical protein